MDLVIEILWPKMKLKEYQGKELFKRYEIPIPYGFITSSASNIDENLNKISSDSVIIKAQVLSGKRKKSGLIKSVPKDKAKGTADLILNVSDEVLVEEFVDTEKELFMSLTINRPEKCFNLLFSEQGGIDIEELNEKYPDKIIKIPFFDINDDILAKLNQRIGNDLIQDQIGHITKQLLSLMKEKDAELVEINPLILTKDGKLIAVDSKIVINDNSVFRHPEFIELKNNSLTEIEKKAKESGLNYVDLDGEIGIIGNGAGLVMSTLDAINHFGGSASNFLDIGGGASVDKMEKALGLILTKDIKGIFINIFGGITRCDEIAQGVVNYTKKNQITIPIVIRMIGTNEDKAKEILEKNNIAFIDSMEKGVIEIVKKCQS